MNRSPIRVAARVIVSLVVAAGVLVGALGTLALTLPRLGDPSGRVGLLLVALTPLGLVAAVILLVSASVAALLMRVRVRGRAPSRRGHGWMGAFAWSLAVVGALAAALHLAWLAPLYVGTPPTALPGKPLVVLAQNLEYGDPNALARELTARGVDVLVLSDIGERQYHAVTASAIPRYLPHVLDEGNGPKVYSRYPITAEEGMESIVDTDPAATSPSRMGSVRIEAPTLGTVRLLAAHPVPPYLPGPWATDYRRIESVLAAQASAKEQLPTIIAGDLNATLDHAPLRRIEAFGYTDAVVQTNGGFRPTWPASGTVDAFGVPVPPLVQIDHVMVSGPLVVTSTSSVVIPGADHLGVIASVQRAVG